MRTDESIAIVGCSCRFPKAADLDSFWELLTAGRDAITEVPEGRWPSGQAPHARAGGFLDDVDLFDADFFGISPNEAAAMDPQQRLILELAWEAMEDAAIVPASLRGSGCGVFIGAAADDYSAMVALGGPAAITRHSLTGLHRGIIANRVSFTLGLHGPSLAVDTGQSSSAVAVHLACRSILGGECALAVAGGVNLNLVAGSALRAERFGALSPDGRCHTFDARANGYVRGEGGGVIVLKPLSDALADGDRVYCVVLGSAVNSDGDKDSLAVPNQLAQEAVLRAACARAAVDPASIQYVELHGTGTRVGDPVEAAALGGALGAGRDAGRPLLVGSVKTNIGHLEGAAGIAGVLKAALCIRRREIPPSLNFVTPNPDIPLDRLNLAVRSTGGPWPRPDEPLLAGVSSFGMGGTNCHLLLGQAPGAAVEAPGEVGPLLAWPISARSRGALRGQAARLSDFLAARSDLGLADVGFSLASTRSSFEHRAVVVARTRADFLRGLADLARGAPSPAVLDGRCDAPSGPGFVFSGQDTGWAAAAWLRLRDVSVFRREVLACAEAVDAHSDLSLADLLRHEPVDRDEVAQPLRLAVMLGLAALWRSVGVRPDAVVGRGIGEVAAARAAGALSIEDAARLAVWRGREAAEPPGVRPRPAEVAVYSAVTGERLAATDLDSGHWSRALGEHTRFERALGAMANDGHPVLIEIGPRTLNANQAPVAVAMEGGGWQEFLRAAARAHVRGTTVAWQVVNAEFGGRRVPLPTYAFQRERHWLACDPAGPPAPVEAPQPAGVPAASGPVRAGSVREVVLDAAAATLGHRQLAAGDATRTFKDLGFDSHAALELRDRVGDVTGLRLPASLVFDHPTPAALADHLRDRLAATEPAPAAASLDAALHTIGAAVAGLTVDDERAAVRARLLELVWRLDEEGAGTENGTDEELLATLEREFGPPPGPPHDRGDPHGE
ncbi:type I polyketide synthase [Solihabitans fulvus]|nr:type I polyketide synthase [Solihabitans fulvus]